MYFGAMMKPRFRCVYNGIRLFLITTATLLIYKQYLKGRHTWNTTASTDNKLDQSLSTFQQQGRRIGYNQVKKQQQIASARTNRRRFLGDLSALNHNILKEKVGNHRELVYFGLSASVNKGDSALGLAGLLAAAALNKTIIYYCFSRCNIVDMNRTIAMHSANHVAILGHGGGNIGIWAGPQEEREDVIKTFPDHKIIILGQSVYLGSKYSYYNLQIRRWFSAGKDVTILTRDRYSYNLVTDNFPRVSNRLIPDSAVRLGQNDRTMLPMYDTIVLTRHDLECKYFCNSSVLNFPSEISYLAMDWLNWNIDSNIDTFQQMIVQTYTGLLFLQRGRIIITDRLHGLILGSLTEQPIIYLDNGIGKLGHYSDTWMAKFPHLYKARTVEHAIHLVHQLLKTGVSPHVAQFAKSV